MKVDVQSVGSYQRKLTVTIPPDRVRNQLDTAYRQLARQVRLPGFRPGKAPRRVLEARYGERIEADVANDLIQEGWRSVLTDHDLEPVSQPSLSDTGAVKSSDGFTFTITVDVRPDIELEVYQGVEVGYPKVEVTDDELEQAVRSRLEGQSRLEEVTDRPVEAGDMVLVELVARDGDDEVHREPGTMIRTEGDPYFPGIEDVIVGMKADEEKDAKVTFDEDARTEAIAGRELDVHVQVMSIQSYTVPELTDELAEEMGFEGGVDGMKVTLQGQLRASREEMARNQARANLLEVLIEKNPFEVPEGMVEQSLGMLVEELRMAQAYRTGRNPQEIGFSDEQIADLRLRAQFAAKASLILDHVSKTEEIEVTDADLDAKYQELADQYGQTVEAVKGRFLKDGDLDELRERISEEKTLDWLLEHAELVDVKDEPEEAEAAPAESEKVEKPKKAEKAEPEEEAVPAGDADLSVLNGAIGKLKEALATGDHDAHLDALEAAEDAGKGRKGALAAIRARRKEVG